MSSDAGPSGAAGAGAVGGPDFGNCAEQVEHTWVFDLADPCQPEEVAAVVPPPPARMSDARLQYEGS